MALKIEKYLSDETCEQIRQEIEAAENNEVFFIGKSNTSNIVDEVTVMARGNKNSVPAIIANCKKGISSSTTILLAISHPRLQTL